MDAILNTLSETWASLEGMSFGGIELTTLLTWFAAGIVAGILLMGRRPVGFLGDMVIGVLGGLLGGWVTQATGFRLSELIGGMDDNPGLRDFIGNFLTAVVGAIVVLILLRLIIRKRA